MIFDYINTYTASQLNGKWGEDIPVDVFIKYEQEQLLGAKKKEQDDINKDDKISKGKNKEEELLNSTRIKELNEVELRKMKNEFRHKYSAEIEKMDKGLTSDQSLFDIAKRKSILLDDFLHLMKQSAIDCRFNRDLNIASDPKLVNIECHGGIERKDGEKENYQWDYQWDIKSGSKPKDLGKEEVKKEVLKTKNIRLFVKVNGKIIRAIINVASDKIKNETSPISDELLINGQPIYDYYEYYGLNYKSNKPSKELNQIGVIKKEGGKIERVIDKLTDEQIADYVLIEECIGEDNPPEDEIERVQWAQKIRDCHLSKKPPADMPKIKGMNPRVYQEMLRLNLLGPIHKKETIENEKKNEGQTEREGIKIEELVEEVGEQKIEKKFKIERRNIRGN